MATTMILVDGMTCGHCVSAVTEELSALPGVTGVEVDLQAGGVSPVRLSSVAPLDRQSVAAAVDEAGYTLAGYTLANCPGDGAPGEGAPDGRSRRPGT